MLRWSTPNDAHYEAMHQFLAGTVRPVPPAQAARLSEIPIEGRTLDHPAFEPWWSLLEELGVPALIHEGTSQNYDQAGLDRYDNYLFRHVVSHAHERLDRPRAEDGVVAAEQPLVDSFALGLGEHGLERGQVPVDVVDDPEH